MTFLAPTALIFLFGIAIPVLIHFLNRFNVKKVNFSSVRFLKSMEDNSIRNVKFKKLLLLILRIGIISALIDGVVVIAKDETIVTVFHKKMRFRK